MKIIQKIAGIGLVSLILLTSPVFAVTSYYSNNNGVKVQSPTSSFTIPRGASAQCKDGTYSFSKHRSGTCSGHKGVKRWL
jgi:hypothetical protein